MTPSRKSTPPSRPGDERTSAQEGGHGPSRPNGARGRFVDSAAGKAVVNLGFLALSAILFALSFPSIISDWGWFPLGFICLVPVFLVVHRASWPAVPLYGLFFGYVSYALFNFWLARFHPLTLVIVPPIYAAYFLVVFPALKLADAVFPMYGFMPQAALWVCYEYFMKSNGFLAYSYGNIGYSQYLFLPLVRTSALFGVWGVSFVLVLPQAMVAGALRDGISSFRARMRRLAVPAAAYGAVFAGLIVYGLASRTDLSGDRIWKVALVQQNVDPWRGGYQAYSDSLDADLRQSDAALKESPEIVIWSETSFVPAIEWHTRYRTDPKTYELVKKLKDYLAAQKVPFVIGNDDGKLEKSASGEEGRVDYNAAIMFRRGQAVTTYHKLHLVPFTESFPFPRTLPRIYQWLANADTHFWQKGTERTVFDADGVRFSTPICFEDTFGDLCRGFFLAGADVLVNMTNDSWSFSTAAEMQHMSIAVFRAAENRRSVVRSTNGGITCIIDPNGRILSLLTPFTETYLVGNVPVHTAGRTLYLRWGDWFPWVSLAAAGTFMLAGAARGIALKRRRG